MAILLVGDCAGASDAEDATAFLVQWVNDWNAQDERALFGVFLPDGILVEPGGRELVGDEVATAWSWFVSSCSMERTGDAVDNGDGSFTFDVEWTRSSRAVDRRTLTITMDEGELVRMVEGYQD